MYLAEIGKKQELIFGAAIKELAPLLLRDLDKLQTVTPQFPNVKYSIKYISAFVKKLSRVNAFSKKAPIRNKGKLFTLTRYHLKLNC